LTAQVRPANWIVRLYCSLKSIASGARLAGIRLSLTSGTTYNFTQSISGGFNLGYRQNKDLKTEITTRGITIALNGQFRF
jgi:hypothetical protein